MAFFLAAAAVAGVVGKAIGTTQAASDRQEAREAMARITMLSNAQKKRQFLNKFRTVQANNLSVGAGTIGGLDSSRTQGQVAATASQAGQGVAEFEAKKQFAATANRKLSEAAHAEMMGNLAGSLTSVAGSAAQFSS
jgi:hypothetical protein